MTVKEIRERLKHIAGLCYGLSADLQYLEIENARLKNENDGIKGLLAEKEKELRKIRSAIHAREYMSKKCAENPEKYYAKVKENNRKAREKKQQKKNKENGNER